MTAVGDGQGADGDGGGPVAFVLGGGGVWGSTQVGMLRALFAAGIAPDLVLGTSVGAINGALVAADPGPGAVARLTDLWQSLAGSGVFGSSPLAQLRNVLQSRTFVQSPGPLRELVERQVGASTIEQLPVSYECVAASVESASAHWFSRGPVVDAVMASCAVPGLLPAVEIDGEHFLDGGLVHSIPVGRAVALGARTIYVLQVGRAERPLSPPRWPWEVALVAFEVARRHRYVEELRSLPSSTTVHVLPSGVSDTPLVTLRYRDLSAVERRISSAYDASRDYLAAAAARS